MKQRTDHAHDHFRIGIFTIMISKTPDLVSTTLKRKHNLFLLQLGIWATLAHVLIAMQRPTPFQTVLQRTRIAVELPGGAEGVPVSCHKVVGSDALVRDAEVELAAGGCARLGARNVERLGKPGWLELRGERGVGLAPGLVAAAPLLDELVVHVVAVVVSRGDEEGYLMMMMLMVMR